MHYHNIQKNKPPWLIYSLTAINHVKLLIYTIFIISKAFYILNYISLFLEFQRIEEIDQKFGGFCFRKFKGILVHQLYARLSKVCCARIIFIFFKHKLYFSVCIIVINLIQNKSAHSVSLMFQTNFIFLRLHKSLLVVSVDQGKKCMLGQKIVPSLQHQYFILW